MKSITIFWFRRDLRIEDNCGLFHALKENKNVLPIFIYDLNILKNFSDDDPRIEFIYNSLKLLDNTFPDVEMDIYDWEEGIVKVIFTVDKEEDE